MSFNWFFSLFLFDIVLLGRDLFKSFDCFELILVFLNCFCLNNLSWFRLNYFLLWLNWIFHNFFNLLHLLFFNNFLHSFCFLMEFNFNGNINLLFSFLLLLRCFLYFRLWCFLLSLWLCLLCLLFFLLSFFDFLLSCLCLFNFWFFLDLKQYFLWGSFLINFLSGILSVHFLLLVIDYLNYKDFEDIGSYFII